jgi:5-methyltetrahydrofolate--homocysteine methyltransferase
MTPFDRLFSSKGFLLADGAVGTMLMSDGLDPGDAPESWNVAHPERVRAVHRGYVQAGCDIILTNSFGGSRFRLERRGLQGRVAELNRAAATLARAEADAAPRPVAVGGSIGPSGEFFEPWGVLSFAEARDGFAEQVAALVDGGVGVLWLETMSDLQELQAAALGVRDVTDLPIVTTLTFDTNGRTMMGVTPLQALAAMHELGAFALGANCGNGPDEIEGVIRAMHAADPAAILVAKSNAGLPEYVGGVLTYAGTPEMMAGHAVRVRGLGARIIGACCGSTPEHLSAMAAVLASERTEPVAAEEEPARDETSHSDPHRRQGQP